VSEQVRVEVPDDLFGEDGEVELQTWRANEGAHVVEGSPLADVASAKVVAEVAAPAAGILSQLVAEGAMVARGVAIGVIQRD
jgi:pyruvate/2-oxoglutarate dehydrogenase complex dihydrolipoamide acyltransferase (E2) component